MITENKMRILVLCPYPQGVAAGQRLKYEQYLDDWRQEGYETIVSPFMDETMWNMVYLPGNYFAKALGVLRGNLRRVRDMFRVPRFDLIYVFMWVTPFGTSLFERLTRHLAQCLIFDVEDSVLVNQPLPANYNPNLLLKLIRGRGKALYLIAKSDHVITSSPFLNYDCAKLNEHGASTYITSSVDIERYVPKQAYTNDDKVTIGWTGTFSSRLFLDLLRPVFIRLATRREFRLIIIGNFEYELDGVDLQVIQWAKEREIDDLQAIDIGVYPLPTDDWVLGKSGLKAIQYMAMALPTVASRVGTTPMIIEHGTSGLLVETEDEWLGALETLIDCPDLRRQLGTNARRRVVENYSVGAVRGRYRDVLRSTVAQKARRTTPGTARKI